MNSTCVVLLLVTVVVALMGVASPAPAPDPAPFPTPIATPDPTKKFKKGAGESVRYVHSPAPVVSLVPSSPVSPYHQLGPLVRTKPLYVSGFQQQPYQEARVVHVVENPSPVYGLGSSYGNSYKKYGR